MTVPTIAARFARLVTGLSLDEVPPAVVTRGSRLALDTLGNALAASTTRFGRTAVETAERLGGPAESAVIGSRMRVGAANAILANGTLAHGLDFDDTREDAIVHTDYPRQFVGHVRVRLTDGRILEAHQDHPRGGPDFPMSDKELDAKFRDNARSALPDERIDRIVDAVARLRELASVGPLAAALVP